MMSTRKCTYKSSKTNHRVPRQPVECKQLLRGLQSGYPRSTVRTVVSLASMSTYLSHMGWNISRVHYSERNSDGHLSIIADGRSRMASVEPRKNGQLEPRPEGFISCAKIDGERAVPTKTARFLPFSLLQSLCGGVRVIFFSFLCL